jgi:hypothetical protein
MAILRATKAPNLINAPQAYVAYHFDQFSRELRVYFNALDNALQALFGPRGGDYLTCSYGAFSSSVSQGDGSTTTAYPITYDTTDFSSGVSYENRTASFTGTINDGIPPGAGTVLTVSAVASGTIYPGMILTGGSITANTRIVSQTSGTTGGVGVYVVGTSQERTSTAITGTVASKIVVDTAGIYNIQFSVQFVNTDGQIHDTDIWFRKNGVDIANSNSQFSVPNKHGSVDGHSIAALNFFVELAATDYIELMWATQNTGLTIQAIAAQVSPTRPATPSVIVTVTRVSDVVSDIYA